MELRNLRVFVEVVRQGGFSAAAKTAFMTQPSVSKAVKQLEDECGAQLLERLGGGVRLTDAGEVVYGRALAMLAERDRLLADLAELQGLIQGKLRLGLPPFGSSLLFAPLIAEYRSLHPGVEIDLLERGSAALEEAVLEGHIELAVSLLPVADDFARLEVRDDPLMAVLWRDHPLAARSSVRLAELAETPFILYDKGFALTSRIEAACLRRGFSPQAVARSGQVDFIFALVAAGLGVALMPRVMTERQGALPVRAVLLDEADLRWCAVIVWRRGAHLSPPARAWLALAAAHFGTGRSGPDATDATGAAD
ncbi:transcriptional regulator, LysR family [Desulfovibrio sp. X2]|uniref:LysR family transcriptional regulator n=1 Tax=Desulfovibrio sp. X2 TaxID=941449 RepID=UPI000358CA2F|nr:LysR family transcriptional regulator [Desulfovibrio sp. X2]EPR43734.1 transcriptional regulator, LysR family [Desulfovibrio sp. X2]